MFMKRIITIVPNYPRDTRISKLGPLTQEKHLLGPFAQKAQPIPAAADLVAQQIDVLNVQHSVGVEITGNREREVDVVERGVEVSRTIVQC